MDDDWGSCKSDRFSISLTAGRKPYITHKSNEHILQICAKRIFGKVRREAQKR